MFKKLAPIALLSALPQVLAHGGVLSIAVGGTNYAGWSPYNTPTGQSSVIRPWSSYNPIQGATSTTLACNDDGTSGAAQLTATVPAGSKVIAYWNQVWPHNTGPMLFYLANCGGSTCTGVNANSLKWFKIYEAGLLSGSVGNGTWAAGQMIAQNSSWTVTIPSTVPNGNYLLRMETIALHSMPAQFYPECAQIQITGGGSLAPTSSQLVSFPGAYSDTDPGLNIDLYSNAALTQTTYVIPGPPLYGSASTGSSGGGTTVNTPPPASTTVVKSTTASAPSSTAATAAHYAQCGGQGWTGATVCAAPYTCTVSSQYYSQCL